ncbi:hypothetical protein CAEBREN_08363 [Caenorhabditis brenneri]|uniref:NTF2-like domain-containing protein n=1 Tax=Caenorhabditis brenneri TaxID=135651 RepID=G0MNY9_CAEBE|nr:hypothetical protein CAEBREN_08363 [Caenorhabditis brenneri]
MWATPIVFFLFLAGTSPFEYPTVLELPDVFMNKMKEAYNTQDDILIRANFQPDFQFKTCFETFGRRRSIDVMKSFPFGNSNTKILNVTTVGDSHIEFILALDAPGQTNIQFVFVIHRFLLKLEKVRLAQCPKPISSRGKRSFDNSNTIIRKFLGILKQAIVTRDSTKIGKLIDDLFIFEGCQGSYNKVETINKIVRIPKEANIDFNLNSSTWKNHGQIEYKVTVSKALLDDIDAQFVYCPYRQILKSGSVLSCPLRRVNRSCFGIPEFFC